MADLTNILNRIEAIEASLSNAHAIAGSNLLVDQIVRIHQRGEASDGTKLGNGYSEKAYFTSLDRFISKGGIPKENISKNNKWVQLPEGYKSFREYSGRQTAYVDLDYTSLMRQSYRMRPTESGFELFYDGATNPQSKGVTPIQKMRYAEANFGKKIVSMSEDEKLNVLNDYRKAIQNALS